MKHNKILSVLIASTAFLSVSSFAEKMAETVQNANQKVSQQNDMDDSDYDVDVEEYGVEEVGVVEEYDSNGDVVAVGEEEQGEFVEEDVVEGDDDMSQVVTTRQNKN